ncbi:hypothetical protein SEPCBS119000_001378 [Sporothrix epigloea]|uniref:RRM domain-containing protein n=1 Tax=Sporothrix epigloea TaxID=1892477 RepID=A0ABP0DAC8_9PEZI
MNQSPQSVRRAVLRSAASASASVGRTATLTSATPFVRSTAVQNVFRPILSSLAVAGRNFSHTARVAEEADPAAATVAGATPAPTSARPNANEGETPYGVHIRNIVFDATEAHLKEAFEHYGPVSRCVIARDTRGLSRGYGFVWFESAEAKEKAKAEANGSFWHGRRLEVGDRQPRARPNNAASERAMREPTDSVYIGNLPYETTDADLNTIFGDLEGLENVRVAVDRATGWPRGFAHCDFKSVEQAIAAVELLKTMQIGSRTLRLDYAEPSKNRRNRYQNKTSEKSSPKASEE